MRVADAQATEHALVDKVNELKEAADNLFAKVSFRKAAIELEKCAQMINNFILFHSPTEQVISLKIMVLESLAACFLALQRSDKAC